MIAHGKDIKVFTGNSNPKLAQNICQELGIPLGDSEVGAFSDGENFASIYETVRGSDVFVVQSTCSFRKDDKSGSVNDALMELLIMIDALRRASAGRITAVIPYFGYARQDRKTKPRDPISAKLVANLIAEAGADRVLTMDLHANQIQGFFDIPVDNLLGSPIFVDHFTKKYADCHDDTMVVSPDVGVGGPGPGLCPEAGHAPGHRGQAPPEGQLLRGHEHHRRRAGQARHPAGRYGGYGRLPVPRGSRP